MNTLPEIEADKNEPGRFLGEGVSFRAKLIGVLEVPEARGDRMCQEALADLKMAIRAAGEHKQRIQVHVAIDGLRLRDDKTGDSLYHHPVHKISFIAQDMTDSRAFGYIFGSPDTGHRFFGIKTDKAASQVVIAMRDLFQVVFELKKKEIELARQQLEAKHCSSLIVPRDFSKKSELKSKNVSANNESSGSGSLSTISVGGIDAAEGGVAELVDLEQELSSLRRGLTQVEGLTPPTDPFGDSFTAPPTQKGLLPPPPSGSSARGRITPANSTASSTPRAPLFSPTRGTSAPATSLPFDLAPIGSDLNTSSPVSLSEKITADFTMAPQPISFAMSSLSYDVFTELDPLGTGRSKPYVDKKLFFQELKNPPKKVLKDLVPTNGGSSIHSDILTVTSTTDTAKGDQSYSATTLTSVPRQSGGSVSIVKPQSSLSSTLFTTDPFAETDPFDSADPFSESLKDDPFKSSFQEMPSSNLHRSFNIRTKLSRDIGNENKLEDKVGTEYTKSVFNGPLQVSLPPEPAPKSPRLARHVISELNVSAIRQRPQPSSKLNSESASPPPPLPPKKISEVAGSKPPPRPPHSDAEHADSGAESGPPLPRPSRRREPTADRTMKPRLSSAATNSSEDEYLAPAPPPLPGGRRFDITLSQLLTCGLDELATRLRVPATELASMTLPQLTSYLRDYLAADHDRAKIHIEPTFQTKREKAVEKPKLSRELKSQFEDNFTASHDSSDTFVANFDDFDKKANPSYDRYAVFREIQEEELKAKTVEEVNENENQNGDNEEDFDEKEELTLEELNKINRETKSNELHDTKDNLSRRSPLKTLDELTMDSFNMFRNSVSPKPTNIDMKIEDIKTVMKNLQFDTDRSISPKDTQKEDKACDRYAALREITITEPQDEFESIPPEAPKERKRSDEKSDGFDNSDFFDCIDNSSLSISHVDEAFRKSPVVKEKVDLTLKPPTEVKKLKPVQIEPTPKTPKVTRLSTGSLSDVASASSPDTKDKNASRRDAEGAGRWSVLAARASPWSSDSKDSESATWRDRRSPPAIPRPRRRHHHTHSRQTSSSSRDVSPWDEDPPPISRHHRTRDSRHNSSGSRECADSGSGRDKEKLRDKRDSRDRDSTRDSGSARERDHRDSGSGRDRNRDISKERDHGRDRRDKRSRDRDKESWDRDRDFSRERDYRDSRSRERISKEYIDNKRERHRRTHHSWDDDEECLCDSYSDGCGSGRSSPRERWPEHRRKRDERNYGSLGWRESRRRTEQRQIEEPNDRRYGATLGWGGRRAGTGSGMRSRESERRRAPRRDEPQSRHRHVPLLRDQRFSNDFSERDQSSPFDNEFSETPTSKKRPNYATLEATRFAFESEEITASPLSGGSRIGDSPATRFRFESESVSPRSLFEDDFTITPKTRTVSIAEEEECEVPPLRSKPRTQTNPDIKKSESVNIFVRETDPFEGDDFFACTGSDRAARRENWPGDFQTFENV